MKKTNESVDNLHECYNINLDDDITLNEPITDDEIKKAIKNLNKITKLLVVTIL